MTLHDVVVQGHLSPEPAPARHGSSTRPRPVERGGGVGAPAGRLRSTAPSAAFEVTTLREGAERAHPDEAAVDLEALDPRAGLSTRASDGACPVHRFVIDVPPDFTGSGEILWRGRLDRSRDARLEAWNGAVRRWEQLSSGPGTGATLLSGSVTDEHVEGGTLSVRVVARDPFTEDTAGTGVQRATRGLRPPESYDFALAHVSGTGTAMTMATWADSPDDTELWADVVDEGLRWLVAQASERKIAYLAHTGDVVEASCTDPTREADVEAVRAELRTADGMLRRLDVEALPFGVLPGARDGLRAADGGASLFNEWFGPERFDAAARRWEGARYEGPWRPGDNSHHVDLLDVPGASLVLVHLGHAPGADALAWARERLAAHPDRDAVLLTHDYLEPSPRPDGREGRRTPQGERLFAEVVAPSPNVRLVLCGNERGVARNLVRDAGRPGHHVVELLADYRDYEVGGTRGMTGFLRLLQVDVERGELTVTSLSPFLDEFDPAPYDPAARYAQGSDTFTVPLALRSRATVLVTDAVVLMDRPEG